MQIKLNVNLGIHDARKYDIEKGFENSVHDVPTETAAALIAKGWAVEAAAEPASTPTRSVPPTRPARPADDK